MIKKLVFIFIFILLCSSTAFSATNWYVRTGAGGNGTSWASAWSNVSNIVWSSLSAGDTVWIAGGTYSDLVVGKSGNADTVAGRIFVKKATTSSHGSDTGWSNGYDTQVVLASIYWPSLNTGSYVTIDGQVASGIYIHNNAGVFNQVDIQRGNSYITLRYLDLAGPCGNTACVTGGDNRMIDTTAWNGSSYETIDHLLIQYSKLHGGCTLMWLIAQNSTIEYNEFYDNDATDWKAPPDGNDCHPNIIATQESSNITFRYNKVYNYADEGIMMIGGSAGTWYIYGNTFGPGMNGTNSRPIETQDGSNGPVYFYNNTVVDLTIGINTANSGTWASGSMNKNNIWWNTDCDGLTNAYNFGSGSCSGTGSISSGSNPFVNYAGKNYQIVSTVGTKYPKDKGTALGSPYNVDMLGVTRGSDGTWDIGAYEYGVGGGGDTTPPTITAFSIATSPQNNLTVTGITFTATDDTAVTGYCIVETNDSSGCAWSGTTITSHTFATAGSKTLYAFAKDAIPNVSSSSNLSVVVDTTIPTISSFTIPATSTSLTVAISTFTGSDNVAVGTYCIVETNSSAGCSWVGSAPANHTFGSAGSKTLYAFVKDTAGNISNSSNASVTIDTAVPTISVFTIPATSTTLAISGITFTASDNNGVTGYCIMETNTSAGCSWSGSTITTHTFGTYGNKTLYAFAKDAVGNISNSSSANIIVDNTIPTISSFTIPATSGSLTVAISTFTASDNIAVTGYCIMETNTSVGCSWVGSAPANHTFGSSGVKTLYAFAKDATGNISNSSSASVTIDTSIPTISSFTLPATATNLTVTISTFSASDDVGITGYCIMETNTSVEVSLRKALI